MIIRLAKLSDMQAVWDFQDRELQGSNRSEFWGDTVWERTILDNKLLVAMGSEDRLHGFLRFHQDQGSFNILYLNVAKNKRGQKVGEKLFKSALAIADKQNLPVTLSVSPQNKVAIGLYEKFGFAALPIEQQDSEMAGLSSRMKREPFAPVKP